MATLTSPLPLPNPARWWQDPTNRRRILTFALLATVYSAGLAYGSWTRVCAAERCPSISRLIQVQGAGQTQTTKVYAADGRLIAEYGLERRTVVPLSQIPPPVRQAFIATEDKRFYAHHGIDYWRILGAIKADLVSLGYSQGFSTITMQLARNIVPDEISREKKLTRKLKEARVALEIERNLPKDTILQLYLNQIDLGAGAHGVEAAAQIYFGKSARDHPQGARHLQPPHPSRPRRAPAQRRAEPDAGPGLPQPRGHRVLEGVSARADHEPHQLRGRGAVLRRMAARPARRPL